MQNKPGYSFGKYEDKNSGQALYQPLDTTETSYYHPDFVTTPYERFAKPAQPDDFLQSIIPVDLYPKIKADHSSANLMTPFLDREGQLDIDKIFNTVGKASSVYQQLSPVIKDLGTVITNFKS